jgi:hypothetical protein
VKATARVLATNGVGPPGVGIRVRENLAVEWNPWEELEWSDGELGGLDDRDADHRGPSGVIGPNDTDPAIAPGLELGETGWVVSTLEPRFEQIARQTVVAAWRHAQARETRSMWLVAGDVDGTIRSLEGETFTVVNSADDTTHLVASDEVESWGVAAASGFCIGPWSAYKVPVIEDVEARWHDDAGPPVCSECGKPLDETHSHEAT